MKSLCAVLTATVLGVAAFSAPTFANAGQPTTTSLDGFADILTDPAHAQVFISEGAADKVAVTDPQGHVTDTLSDLAGASGLVLSADASTLYVALSAGDAIAAVDTTTLAVSSIATGAGTCPSQVAVTADALWFSYGCTTSDGNLGAIDLATQGVHTGLIADDYTGAAPILTADPTQLDGSLFVGQPAPLHGDLYLYDVTGGSTPTAVVRNHRIAGSDLQDMAITPAGTQLVVTAEANTSARRFSTADLTPVAGLVTGIGPGAVAIRPDGMVAVGREQYVPNTEIFKPGYRGMFRTYELGDGSALQLQPRGLAFGNTQLFAVTAHPGGADPELHVVLPKHLTTLTIRTDRAVYNYDDAATVTAHLGYTVANRVVTISVTPYGGTSRVVKRAKVDAAGNLTAVTHVLRRSTFTATFGGDAQSSSAMTHVVRQVHARVSNSLRRWYGQSGSYHLYHVNVDPILTTTVAPRAPGTCVYFRGQYPVDGGWKTFATTPCVRLDDASRAGVILNGTHVVGERDRLRAEWRTHPANLGAYGAWQYIEFTSSAKATGPGPAASVGLPTRHLGGALTPLAS